jgi:hypothetical protein
MRCYEPGLKGRHPIRILLAVSILAFSQVQAQSPERPDRDASREEIREYRIALKKHRQATRDGARRENNLMVGIAPSMNLFFHEADSNPHIDETAPCLGVNVAYRTHFFPKLGVKAGSQIFMGTSTVSSVHDTTYSEYGARYSDLRSSSGDIGTVYGFNTSVQGILGPFGRFALEPGVGLTWGGQSTDSVALSGEAGSSTYVPQGHFSYLNGILGASLFLGHRDQFNISPAVIVGFAQGTRDSFQVQFNLALTYAIRLPKK